MLDIFIVSLTNASAPSLCRHLIYNFAIDGYIFEEKQLELVLEPIKNGQVGRIESDVTYQ